MVVGGVSEYLQALAPFSHVNAAGSVNVGTEEQALEMVTTQFEAVFIGAMLKQMRSTTLESGLFGNDRASKIYREMHDEAVANQLAATGSLGIGKMMLEELRGAALARSAQSAYAEMSAGGA